MWLLTRCARRCTFIALFFCACAVAELFASALPLAQPVQADGSACVPFADFVRRHHPELMRYFRTRVHNIDDAADLAQECYARLLRYREGHTEASLQLLLFRIAKNLLTDSWRAQQAHHADEHVDIGELDIPAGAPSHFDHLHGQQQLSRLKDVIGTLPPKCQAVFVFSRIDGLSHAEIAQKCGITPKAVEKHITKALAACRAALGDEDEA